MTRSKVPHHPAQKVHLGNGYILIQYLKITSLLLLHFAQDELKLSAYILQDATVRINQDLQYNHFKCPTANINPNP